MIRLLILRRPGVGRCVVIVDEKVRLKLKVEGRGKGRIGFGGRLSGRRKMQHQLIITKPNQLRHQVTSQSIRCCKPRCAERREVSCVIANFGNIDSIVNQQAATTTYEAYLLGVSGVCLLLLTDRRQPVPDAFKQR